MVNNLVTFGCGWTHGVELPLPQEQAYPALIASEMGWAIENLATPKATLHEIILDLRNWLINHTVEEIDQTLIIIGLPDEDQSSSPTQPADVVYTEAVTEIDEIAVEYAAHILQFNVLTKNYKIKLPTLIDSSSALEMLVIRDKPRKDTLFTEHKFPNEKGHKIVSEFLISKINSAIIIK